MRRRLASTLLLVIVGVGCSGTDSGAVFTADEVPSPTPPPTTQLVVPFTTLPAGLTSSTSSPSATAPLATVDPAGSLIVLERLSSPENGIAEVAGTGATATDTVTLDGTETAFLSFDAGLGGGFVARVSVPDAGSHTVCIRSTCGMVDIAG